MIVYGEYSKSSVVKYRENKTSTLIRSYIYMCTRVPKAKREITVFHANTPHYNITYKVWPENNETFDRKTFYLTI